MFRTDTLQITPEILRLIAQIDEFSREHEHITIGDAIKFT